MPRLNRKLDKLITRRLEAYRQIGEALSLSDQRKKIIANGWIDAIAILETLRWKNYLYAMRSLAALVVCGAMVPAFINVETNHDWLNTAFKIAATSLSIAVTILTGMRQGFKWTEKWKHYHNSAEALKTEGELYAGLAGVYKDYRDHTAAFPTFVQNVNAIKTTQLSDYIGRVASENALHGSNPNPDDMQGDTGKGAASGAKTLGKNTKLTDGGQPSENTSNQAVKQPATAPPQPAPVAPTSGTTPPSQSRSWEEEARANDEEN